MRPGTASSYQERILRVLRHIETNLDAPLPLEEMARVAHFSPFHFHRVFRGVVGESVADHVRRLRLERAAARLRSTEDGILDIALDAGYEAHESFTRAFFTAYGESPSSFRRSQAPVRRADLPDTPPVEANFEVLPRIRVACLRHVGPYDSVGPTWQRLMMWAGWKGLLGPGVQMLGLCYDDPDVTPAGGVRYDAGIVVGNSVQPEHDIRIEEMGGCECAHATHHGPYTRLGETYAALCGVFVQRSGREMADAPPIEFYRNSPQNARDEDLRTDIYVPLRDKEA